MATTFFFYDTETSGLNARTDRIMQFAGQRTDMDLKPIGEPVNELIKLTNDTLPSPEALMVTGITPQQTVADGYSEAEFARKLAEEIFTPGTIAIGFNSVRFDDEFIRHLFWRNFYDAYEWSWKDDRSRWDLLDVVRLTRALRPEGINWPVDDKGEPTNRLELLTEANGIAHQKAHDALGDVEALIEVARLIKSKQPQLFDYLLNMRHKKEVQKLVNLDDKRPFVYASGRYDKQFDKTTVAFPLTSAPHGNVLVYDLRYDPSPLLGLSQSDIEKRLFASWQDRQAKDFVPIPVKQLQYNRCPAVAPLGVLEQGGGWDKIGLSSDTIKQHQDTLLKNPSFAEVLRTIFEARAASHPASDSPEEALYDSFVPDLDKLRLESIREADEQKLADLQPSFTDERLPKLLLHYKARNFPRSLTQSEATQWESWRKGRLEKQMPAIAKSLEEVSKRQLSDHQQFVLAELQLWIEDVLS